MTDPEPPRRRRAWPRRVWLGLGGNLGNRLAHLQAALDALREGGVAIDTVSRVYDTAPWGITEQPHFANLAASGLSALPAPDLLRLCKRIEAEQGRDFTAPRNSARPIDIDILLIEGETVAEASLVVPHPAIPERAFVLVPLAEIAAGLVHPLLGSTIAELLAGVDRDGVAVLDGAGVA